MKSIKIGIIAAVALIGVMLMIGSAAAQGQAVSGPVMNATDGEPAAGKFVTLWVEDVTDDYATDECSQGPPGMGVHYYDDIMPILQRQYINVGDWFNLTVVMYPSGIQRDVYQTVGNPYDNNGYCADPVTAYVQYTGSTINPGMMYMKKAILTRSNPLGYDVSLPAWEPISVTLANTTENMTVEKLIDTSLGSSYDSLCKYDAVNNNWTSLSSSDVMENGVGYFIHMTQADTWTYSGTAYNSMNIELEEGLNLIGTLDTNKTISDALSSIEGNYIYVALWNATLPGNCKYDTNATVAPPAFNDFADMERGGGYFISMKAADTLVEG